MKTTKTVKLWETPSHYFGAEFPEYYVIISQTRDSRALERSNFDAMLKLLGGESKHTNAVIVARFNHWACGWIETIMVHRGASKKIIIADKVMTEYKNYPVINDDLWSEYEDEEKNRYWNSLCLHQKIRECVEAGLSCFAARQEYIPDAVYNRLEV